MPAYTEQVVRREVYQNLYLGMTKLLQELCDTLSTLMKLSQMPVLLSDVVVLMSYGVTSAMMQDVAARIF